MGNEDQTIEKEPDPYKYLTSYIEDVRTLENKRAEARAAFFSITDHNESRKVVSRLGEERDAILSRIDHDEVLVAISRLGRIGKKKGIRILKFILLKDESELGIPNEDDLNNAKKIGKKLCYGGKKNV